MSIYDFEVKDTSGNMVSLSEYEGKVLLIVNSATKCGFTPQYTELNEIFNEVNFICFFHHKNPNFFYW